MKRLIAFFICFIGGSLLLLVLSLMGCNRSDHYFIYSNMTAEVMHRYLADSNVVVALVDGDTAVSGRFYVNVALDITEVDKVTASRFLPGSTLYALQLPELGYYNLEGKISDIKVITLYDYNEDYPAGSDLSDACYFSSTQSMNDSAFIDKAALINESHLPMENGWSSYFSLFNVYTPEASIGSRQQLAIEVRMEQNTVIRDTTVTFLLKP